MPRKRKELTLDINAIRAKFYVGHFECRQFARNHPDRENIARLINSLPKPELTVYGAPGFEGKIDASWLESSKHQAGYYELSKKTGIDVFNLYSWYWSDAGWAEFERLWQALPEVVHIDLCTESRVVHIRTQETYANPAGQP